jgi:cupin 2 domain-containing protein
MRDALHGNLFAALAPAAEEELTTTLLDRPALRIERIVSTGQATPPGFWYDQQSDEWVLLVAGAARLEIAGEGERALSPGDYVLLPAHCRHRVAWTDPDHPTIWLAVHLQPADNK